MVDSYTNGSKLTGAISKTNIRGTSTLFLGKSIVKNQMEMKLRFAFNDWNDSLFLVVPSDVYHCCHSV